MAPFAVRVERSGFQAPHPIQDGITYVDVSWGELLAVAVTVGRGSWQEVVAQRQYSGYEIAYRSLMLFANVQVQHGGLAKSPAFTQLDGSEKSAISYFLGLISAKLAFWKLTDIYWLQHFDAFLRSQGLPITEVRPDLCSIGDIAARDRVVIEAKGLSNGYNRRTMEDALKPKRVRGDWYTAFMPDFYVASVASFGRYGLQLMLADPPIDQSPLRDYAFPAALRQYYRLVNDFLQENHAESEAGGRQVVLAEVPGLDVSVGLTAALFRALAVIDDDAPLLEVVGDLRRMERVRAESLQGGASRGGESRELMPDGLVVIPGPTWTT